MVAIAPGIPLAQRVVPSSGSTAISTFGPLLLPTFSPMKSIGALSRSPSPIAMVPSIGIFVEFPPHGIDGSLVGGDLVAKAPQACSGNCRPLRDTYDFEREDTVQQLLRWDGNDFRHSSTLQRF